MQLIPELLKHKTPHCMASPIFCFNNFATENGADLGIGMNRGGQPDWTFSKSGHDYSSAKLYAFAEFE